MLGTHLSAFAAGTSVCMRNRTDDWTKIIESTLLWRVTDSKDGGKISLPWSLLMLFQRSSIAQCSVQGQVTRCHSTRFRSIGWTETFLVKWTCPLNPFKALIITYRKYPIYIYIYLQLKDNKEEEEENKSKHFIQCILKFWVWWQRKWVSNAIVDSFSPLLDWPMHSLAIKWNSCFCSSGKIRMLFLLVRHGSLATSCNCSDAVVSIDVQLRHDPFVPQTFRTENKRWRKHMLQRFETMRKILSDPDFCLLRFRLLTARNVHRLLMSGGTASNKSYGTWRVVCITKSAIHLKTSWSEIPKHLQHLLSELPDTGYPKKVLMHQFGVFVDVANSEEQCRYNVLDSIQKCSRRWVRAFSFNCVQFTSTSVRYVAVAAKIDANGLDRLFQWIRKDMAHLHTNYAAMHLEYQHHILFYYHWLFFQPNVCIRTGSIRKQGKACFLSRIFVLLRHLYQRHIAFVESSRLDAHEAAHVGCQQHCKCGMINQQQMRCSLHCNTRSDARKRFRW
jgi:hypothetical protein